MKKSFIIQSATIVAISAICFSCENEDEFASESQSVKSIVSMNAMMDGDAAESRAAEITTDLLRTFSIKAYNATGSEHLTGTYTRADATGAFAESGSNVFYWPSDGKLTFRAMTNYKYSGTAYTNTATIPGITCSSTGFSGDYEVEASNQSDPCIAVTTTTSKPADGTVDLKFYHILSRVGINARHDAGNENLSLRITGYKIYGANKQGTFTYTANGIDGKGSDKQMKAGVWTGTSTGDFSQSVSMAADTYLSADAITTPSLLAGAEYINVIPGTVITKIDLTVEFYNSTDKNLVATKTMTASSFTDVATSYQPGFGYIYNFTIKGNGGAVDDYKITLTIQTS